MGVDAEIFVKLAAPITNEQLKKASYIFGSAFHYDLMLGHDNTHYHHPIELSKYYKEYDLEIPLSGRYYGPGYERGDLFTYVAMAELLEILFPACTIYYGGDSGEEKEEFDRTKRNELMRYYVKANARDRYVRAFDRDNAGMNCPNCDVQMTQNGWGPSFKLFTCQGCGWVDRTKDGVHTAGYNLKGLI